MKFAPSITAPMPSKKPTERLEDVPVAVAMVTLLEITIVKEPGRHIINAQVMFNFISKTGTLFVRHSKPEMLDHRPGMLKLHDSRRGSGVDAAEQPAFGLESAGAVELAYIINFCNFIISSMAPLTCNLRVM
jgi:hypothetical protein